MARRALGRVRIVAVEREVGDLLRVIVDGHLLVEADRLVLPHPLRLAVLFPGPERLDLGLARARSSRRCCCTSPPLTT